MWNLEPLNDTQQDAHVDPVSALPLLPSSIYRSNNDHRRQHNEHAVAAVPSKKVTFGPTHVTLITPRQSQSSTVEDSQNSCESFPTPRDDDDNIELDCDPAASTRTTNNPSAAAEETRSGRLQEAEECGDGRWVADTPRTVIPLSAPPVPPLGALLLTSDDDLLLSAISNLPSSSTTSSALLPQPVPDASSSSNISTESCTPVLGEGAPSALDMLSDLFAGRSRPLTTCENITHNNNRSNHNRDRGDASSTLLSFCDSPSAEEGEEGGVTTKSSTNHQHNNQEPSLPAPHGNHDNNNKVNPSMEVEQDIPLQHTQSLSPPPPPFHCDDILLASSSGLESVETYATPATTLEDGGCARMLSFTTSGGLSPATAAVPHNISDSVHCTQSLTATATATQHDPTTHRAYTRLFSQEPQQGQGEDEDPPQLDTLDRLEGPSTSSRSSSSSLSSSELSSPEVVCVFCEQSYPSIVQHNEYPMHIHCALWCPEVFCDPMTQSLVNVAHALERSARIPCSLCARTGASIGCVCEDCPASYHFHCALSAGCELVVPTPSRRTDVLENFVLRCPVHKRKSKKTTKRPRTS